MARQCDVLVVGAGVIGTCTAHYLLEAGYRPLVVDRGDICAGASYANAGLIVPSSWTPVTRPGVRRVLARWMRDRTGPVYMAPTADPRFWVWLALFLRASDPERWTRSTQVLQNLAARSVDLYAGLVADLDLDCHFQACGSLHLFTSPSGFHQGAAHALAHRTQGAAAAVLDWEGVRHMLPLVTSAVKGGVFYPRDGRVSPGAFVQALAASVQHRGGEFLVQTEVVGFEKEKDRIRAVHTTRGDIDCNTVVMATGAWSGRLGQELGLYVPVQPAKGYSYTIPRPEGFPDLPVSLSERKISINPLGDRLRVAGTLEFSGFDDSFWPSRARLLGQAVHACLGLDPQPETLERWHGWRPMTPDGVPVIAWSRRYDNLLLATGHNMIGMTLGPVTGEMVARMIRGDQARDERPDLDMARFS